MIDYFKEQEANATATALGKKKDREITSLPRIQPKTTPAVYESLVQEDIRTDERQQPTNLALRLRVVSKPSGSSASFALS